MLSIVHLLKMARVKLVTKAAGAAGLAAIAAKVVESTVLKPEAVGAVVTNSLQLAATELKKNMTVVNPYVVRLATKEDLHRLPPKDADPYKAKAEAQARALSDRALHEALAETRRREAEKEEEPFSADAAWRDWSRRRGLIPIGAPPTK